jgi:2-polyprenyl-3-methyl-5-hydroxy-6-metoxy-1,4-benzoquinol methylase
MVKAFGEKYELDLMPIVIGGKRLELYSVSNWDVFVQRLCREGEAYIKKFPFWVKVWEASIILTDHLADMGMGKTKDVLEIGAGMGITGLFLAAMGHNVTITDYEESALTLLQMNVEHNKLPNVRVEKLDWNTPNLTGRYDIICGSEVIYNKAFIKPIITLFQEYLRPGGSVYLAHDIRRKCLVQFLGMVPGHFEMKNVIKVMKGKDELYKVVVHTIRFKDPQKPCPADGSKVTTLR